MRSAELYNRENSKYKTWRGCGCRSATSICMETHIREFDGQPDREYAGIYDNFGGLNCMPAEFKEFMQPIFEI